MSADDGSVGTIVNDAITYMDSRLEFWKARNPRSIHESSLVTEPVTDNRQSVAHGRRLTTKMVLKEGAGSKKRSLVPIY